MRHQIKPLVLIIILSLVMVTCSTDTISEVAVTPALPPTKLSTPFPTSTLTPTPTPASTSTPIPVVEPQNWRFLGDHIAMGSDSPCLRDFSSGSFILGADSTSCDPGEQGGTAIFNLQAPTPDNTHFFVLRIRCQEFGNCADAVDARLAGTLSLSVDGQVLWTTSCSEDGTCDQLALGEGPAIAFRNGNMQQHRIRLETSPGISWTIAEIETEWLEIPESVQGIAYSPFRDCQSPHIDCFPTESEIREDLALVQHMGNAIRTYSSTDIQMFIPIWAKEAGLRVSAGAWLGPDMDANEEEITSLIELAHMVDLESVIVGNEVLLRGDLTEEQLIGYIQRVRDNIPEHIPVTTAEIGGILLGHPNVIDAVDYLLVHIYAYWDGWSIEGAARYVVDEYHAIQAASGDKPVVIGETGWPAKGPPHGDAVPSLENQRRFLREFVTLAQQEDVEFYYFATFDELWKTEGGVGPYWGIFYPDRSNKYDLQSMLIPLSEQPQSISTQGTLITSTPAPNSAVGGIFYVYHDFGAEENEFIPSGWMGDIEAIRFNDCFKWGDDWADRAIQLKYIPTQNDENGWAGIYWLYPEGNWGTMPESHDLQGYAQLHFRARSDRDGDQVKFFVGGISTGEYPSSIPDPIHAYEADADGFVTLGTEWQEFHIDLQGINLERVIGGFGWAAEQGRTPNGTTFYLDDILFDKEPLAISAPTPITIPPHPIYMGVTLNPGYDMGVNTSDGRTNWVTDINGYMCMSYPKYQQWGAVFITVGRPTNFDRPGQDLSDYQTLSLELKGNSGGESIWIGLKDNTDRDDGTETKIRVSDLTQEWQTFTFPLSDFYTASLDRLYVVTEFVFEPSTPAETVCFRNIQYLP